MRSLEEIAADFDDSRAKMNEPRTIPIMPGLRFMHGDEIMTVTERVSRGEPQTWQAVDATGERTQWYESDVIIAGAEKTWGDVTVAP